MVPGSRWWLCSVAIGAIVAATAAAEPWPGWRGPGGLGISSEPTLPTTWSHSENIAWKTPIPGKGHSSPAVWDNDIFVTAAVGQQRRLYCVDFDTGTIRWERTVLEAPLEPIHPLNSHASSTPATDGKRVFVSFLDTDKLVVAAYDVAGNFLWRTDVGPFASRHGFCSCPVLYEDKLVINGDHDGDAYLAMLEQESGEIVWKTPRPNKTRSYCTPIILPIDGRDQLLLNGSLCTAGYDVRTGEQIWTCDGPSQQMVATLVHHGDLIFSLGGYPQRHLLAIRKGGRGDVTDSHIVWRTHQAIPYVPSPLLYGDYLHVVSDEGIYTCFDPPTGKVHLRQRAGTHFSSSIVGGAGHVYLTDDDGTTTVLRNGPKFDVVAKNALGEEVYSTPAFSRGSILLRGVENLYRIQ